MILCLVDGDPLSLEALTFARRLNAPVEAVVFDDVDLDGYAARVHRVVHERLDEYAPEAWAQAVLDLEPSVVVAPGTGRRVQGSRGASGTERSGPTRSSAGPPGSHVSP